MWVQAKVSNSGEIYWSMKTTVASHWASGEAWGKVGGSRVTNKGWVSSLINRTEKKGEGLDLCILERNIKLSLCECLGRVNEYRKGPKASVKSSISSKGHLSRQWRLLEVFRGWRHCRRMHTGMGSRVECPTGWLCLGKGPHLRG